MRLKKQTDNIEETNISFPKEPFATIKDFHKEFKSCINSSYADSIEGYDFTVKDIKILVRNEWLNDKIINAYFSLIERHSRDVYVFSSYFYSILVKDGFEKVSKWTKNLCIFDYKFILIPVHLKNHWVFVAVDTKNHGIEYYDSLGGYNSEVVKNITRYLEMEQLSKFKYAKTYFSYKNKAPLQANGVDCGVFVCMFARYRAENSKKFYYGSMWDFRLKILHELLSKTIIYDLTHRFQ
ncbi:Sentrin-specific protease [Nosema granulosis]|uniref:Sentrin-specific protease n=1 Tax=Nosema granulosis TaxID=83296 RepID=A0A9P6GWU7_9MICR|nr:Sentrin-specific protease [Nosema granulosis]